jgi:hypothetical protein
MNSNLFDANYLPFANALKKQNVSLHPFKLSTTLKTLPIQTPHPHPNPKTHLSPNPPPVFSWTLKIAPYVQRSQETKPKLENAY